MDENWYLEKTNSVILSHRVKKRVVSTRSRFQAIDIVDTHEFGRMLFLDNMTQSSEVDEFIYHEMMVHPAFFTHRPVSNVCIIGGSEGATLREVLKHGPERVVMIDIDEELVRLCREHLSTWSCGAFEDPRLELVYDDGRKYLEGSKEAFDVILIDISDPLVEGPSTLLFTREFYRTVHERLSPEGCVVVQSESLNPVRIEPHARIRNTLVPIFPIVRPYFYLSHSFHEIYSFVLASKARDPAGMDVQALVEGKDYGLRYYSPELHRGLFCLPRYMHEAYARFDKPITDEDVVYYPDKDR